MITFVMPLIFPSKDKKFIKTSNDMDLFYVCYLETTFAKTHIDCENATQLMQNILAAPRMFDSGDNREKFTPILLSFEPPPPSSETRRYATCIRSRNEELDAIRYHCAFLRLELLETSLLFAEVERELLANRAPHEVAIRAQLMKLGAAVIRIMNIRSAIAALLSQTQSEGASQRAWLAGGENSSV